MKAATRQDLPWIIFWIAGTLLLGSAPYIVGYASQTEDVRFLGYVHLYPEDVCNHLSWARQAYDGQILFEDKFNGKENTESLLFNSLFLLIGSTARLLDWPVVWAFHLERVLAGGCLLLILYHFTSQFFESRRARWTALLLISFSSGLGWLTMLGITHRWSTSDLWMTEVTVFAHLHTDVVITPSVLFMVAAFHFALRHAQTHRVGDAAKAGLATLAVGAVHPHNLVTVFTVFFAWTIFRLLAEERHFIALFLPRTWLLLASATLFTLPVAGYHIYSMLSQPHFLEYAVVQDAIPPRELFPGFGIQGILALFGIASVIRLKDKIAAFLVIWLLCAIGLIYAPLPFAGQFYLCQGLSIPVCLLAVKALAGLKPVLEAKWPAAFSTRGEQAGFVTTCLIGLFVTASSLTTLYVLINEMALASPRRNLLLPHRPLARQKMRHARYFVPLSGRRPISQYFVPRDFLDACEWLDENTRTTDVVLAPPYVSCFIPLLTGNRVYAAATHQTSDFASKRLLTWLFYASHDPPGMRLYLDGNKIDYVLHWLPPTPDERTAFANLMKGVPATVVYENPQAVIFRIERAASRSAAAPNRN